MTMAGQVTVVSLSPFRENPVQVTCSNCHQTAVTVVEYKPGLLAYLTCGGLFLCGCVFGCCLIPFCINSLKDATHVCSKCKAVLGVYKRL